MSTGNHCVSSTTNTSDTSSYSNTYKNDSIIVQYDGAVLNLPRSTVNGNSGSVNLLEQQQRRQVSDDSIKIDQMMLSERSNTPTTLEASQLLQVPIQQQRVIHYPADLMQLGKRKFQNVESCQSHDHSQPSLQNFKFSTETNTTTTQTNHNKLDNEAGLSLLFAASLLQQQQQTCQVSNNATPNMNTEIVLPWEEQQHQQQFQHAYHQYSASSIMEETNANAEIILNDAQTLNVDDGTLIEPRANDGTFLF